MATTDDKDKPISAFDLDSTLKGDEFVPIVKDGVNYKTTLNDIRSGLATDERVTEVEDAQAEDLRKITELAGKLNGIDNVQNALDKYLPLTGGEISGDLSVLGDLSAPSVKIGSGSFGKPAFEVSGNSVKINKLATFFEEVDFGGGIYVDQHLNVDAPATFYGTLTAPIIPTQASATNQLADKDFVNSSISTNTAEFKGTYNSLAELQAVTADDNDYGFVRTTDIDGNTVYNRYKWTPSGWQFEYALNNSSFTAAQWETINSGVTANSFDVLETLTESVNKGLGETIQRVDTLENDVNEINADLENAAFVEEVVDDDILEDFNKITRDELKKDLFIDMWLNRGNYGSKQYTFYDASKGDTPFGIEELWVSYEEALTILSIPCLGIGDATTNSQWYLQFTGRKFRAMFPMFGGLNANIQNLFATYSNPGLEIVRILDYYSNPNNDTPTKATNLSNTIAAFCSCGQLRKWLGYYKTSAAGNYFQGANWPVLEELYIQISKTDTGNLHAFGRSNKVKYDCLKYLVDNANITGMLTVPVHADVYSALLGEANSYPFNGGTQEEWEQLTVSSLAKHITFATA